MNGLNTSLGGKDEQDPFRLMTPPPGVQLPEQLKKDDPFRDLSAKNRLIIILMAITHKFLTKVQAQIDTTRNLNEKDSLVSNLKILKALFTSLKEEDLSQDLEFASCLSNAWHQLTDYFALATRFERKNDFHHEASLLLESINNYPPRDEHSLGFYLTHYAGENWLPFPFMLIIRTLHEEHIKDPHLSHLEVWTQTLSHLIDTFMQSALSSPHLAPE
jgi:hypothetical protein